MSIQEEISEQIHHALEALEIAQDLEIQITETSNPSFGDYTTNVAMQIFPTVDTSVWNSPFMLAQAIAQKLPKATSVKPGFINFTLSDSYFTTTIREILEDRKIVKTNRPKTVVVEYSSPNIAKPFTIGHLRSTIIGDAVANMLEAIGHDVRRDNHLGDWGTQFGKLIVAIQKWGNLEEISSAENPVKDLVELYIKFHEEAEKDPALEDEGRAWFTKLESGDPIARDLWQKCIDWSWKEFDRIYAELGVTFTENGGKGYGESFFEDKMQLVVDTLEKSGFLKEGKEGARLFFFPNDEFPPLMILKKDGSTLYATRDLATDFFRLKKYGKDVLVINEVGAEQELYFRQLYRIEELLGWYSPGQRVHVSHGMFRFKEGKMSTRKGNVIWLSDVITEAKRRAQDLSVATTEETTNMVAIGALKWNDLKRSARLDITFDWDEILSMEGNSGPYVQYTAVRAKSVLSKAKARDFGNPETAFSYDAEERLLARQLSFYQETLERSANEFAPHHLCTYLYTLAGLFNSFYNTHSILGDAEAKSKRLFLTTSVFETLERGLRILGIKIPERM